MSDFKDLFGDWGPEEQGRKGPEGFGSESEERTHRSLNEKEVRVVNVFEGIYESPGSGTTNSTTFVLLRDNKGREFKIFVLRDVAMAISMGMDADPPDRPFTHDLIKNIIERLGAMVDRVTVDDLWHDTFYAKVSLIVGDKSFEVDARPSDAIAIALRFRAPIYAAEAVLEAAQPD